uniref:Uncharacterized protein n=1 Tax=Brassica campestris TaxID=3711 RepID=M4FFB7_BRACM|nr:unnamed protein product [Brassica rapa]
MSKHMIISGRKTEKPVRRTHYMVQLRNAGEYFLADVRGCLYAYPGEVTEKEYRSICKHAHLRELSTNLLCTLHSYKGDHDERIKLPNLQEKGIEASSLGGLEASSLHNGHLQAILELRTGGGRHVRRR